MFLKPRYTDSHVQNISVNILLKYILHTLLLLLLLYQMQDADTWAVNTFTL